MPIPRHSAALASVQLPPAPGCSGVTELRVHGVGGTPPEATLGDLAPEQAWGDRIAGFYRSSDHRALPGDDDVDRHVECYSWGALTSGSKSRVLWLALLPYLLGNLAGWMCSARTRNSSWRFAFHRVSFVLASLALTVNTVLVAVLAGADVLGYQAVRSGLAANQWWLAPLGWNLVREHPARQVLIGAAVPVLLMAGLVLLAYRSWRYEMVRPPYQGDPPHRARSVTAAGLGGGLAHRDFWDGENSVRVLTWLHTAVAAGYLAIVLGVIVRAMSGGWSSHVIALWWVAVCAGSAVVTIAVAYLCADACELLRDKPRRLPRVLAVAATAALAVAGVFAWLQPAASPGDAAGLPGMPAVTGWTVLAIAVPVAAALVSVLIGSGRNWHQALPGGAWVTLVLAFGVLNLVTLGVLTWLAHIVGPVTTDAADAAQAIYVPEALASGVPIMAWATVAGAAAFFAAEAVRWLRARTLPAEALAEYRRRASAFRGEQHGPRRHWYWSGTAPFPPPGDSGTDPSARHWERTVARARLAGGASHDAGWLLWAVVAAQLTGLACIWPLHCLPPLVVRNLGIGISVLLLPALMGFLRSAWKDPARRRQVAMLWDVGTFFPRSYHPLSPPCYTERAVPDLQRRLWWLHDNGGRVVLAAHSQGTMLAIAALAQPDRRPIEDDHPALATLGSPVWRLYAWAFPAYITADLLKPLMPGGGGHVDDWRNFCYPTDPIAGPAAGKPGSPGAGPVDAILDDPAECWYVYGQPPPAPQRHSGYWADPRVWAAINHMAAGGPRIPVPAPRAGDVEGAPAQGSVT